MAAERRVRRVLLNLKRSHWKIGTETNNKSTSDHHENGDLRGRQGAGLISPALYWLVRPLEFSSMISSIGANLVALKSDVAAEKSKDRHLRDFRSCSIFDFFNTIRQQRPFPHRILWNGSSQLLVQQLKEVAYSFERLSIAIADIDHAIAFAL
jgi:hypothetical protein